MINNIIQAINILNNVDKHVDSLSSQLSECDTKLSDLYHYLEVNKLNAVECCKFVKEMQGVCIERRKIKKEMEIGKIYRCELTKLNNTTNRQFFIQDLKKTEKRLNTEYKSKIYTEKELIEKGIKHGDSNRNINGVKTKTILQR